MSCIWLCARNEMMDDRDDFCYKDHQFRFVMAAILMMMMMMMMMMIIIMMMIMTVWMRVMKLFCDCFGVALAVGLETLMVNVRLIYMLNRRTNSNVF